ncbi:hypothetical protein JCM3774_002771 [Rhodotorula dairenensis]
MAQSRAPPDTAATGAADAAARGDGKRPQPAAAKLKESRQFVIETYTVWASLQRIVADYETAAITEQGLNAGVPPPEQVQYYARVSRLYRDAILKQLPLVHNNEQLTPAHKAKSLAHYANMHAILALTEILYLPSDGRGEGLVAEEILDWVNTVDKAPSADEGNELLALASPWDSPNFFPYLHRCLLRGHLASAAALLSLLVAQHPAPYLQTVARVLAETVSAFPRSTQFRTESAFATALRAWRKSSLAPATQHVERLLTVDAKSDPVLGDDADGTGADNGTERQSFEQGFRVVLDILAGGEDAIVDSAADWREALSAFGFWSVPTSLRRADLPAIVDRITSDAHPVDASLPSEVAQLHLFKGDVSGVLKTLAGTFAWLGTHVADLLSHLHLPAFDLPPPLLSSMDDDDAGADGEDAYGTGSLGLREHFLLDWAQRCVSADSGLWRIACEYWSACGKPGRVKARELVMRMDIVAPGEEERDAKKLKQQAEGVAAAAPNGMEVDVTGAGDDAGADSDLVLPEGAGRRVDELLLVCSSLDLEPEFVDICGRYADYLVDRKRYGEAVAYAVRAGDGTKVARIAELIGEEYVVSGQEAFVKHVDSLPTSLLRPSDTDEPSTPTSPTTSGGLASLAHLPSLTSDALRPHLSRLSFLARYRDFLALYAAGARREAAQLLVLLLTSGVAPHKWWAVMLLDAVPLLETTPVLVSLAETYELLRILEEILSPIVVSTPPRDVFGSLELLGRLSESSAPTTKDEAASAGSRAASGPKKSANAKEQPAKQEGDRLRRALGQMDVVRASLAKHLATCCCLE